MKSECEGAADFSTRSTRSTRLIQNAEMDSVFSVGRLKAAFQCVLWLKSRGMKNAAEVGGFCVFWKEKRES